MMLTNKKSTSKSWIKIFALLPIVGAALALNAETVNDYVYEDTPEQPQQQKVVKKGKKNAQVKMGTKTIEVKAEEVATKAKEEKNETATPQDNKKIIFSGTPSENDPLLILDCKVATREQVMALSDDEIDQINVVKNGDTTKELLRTYSKQYDADTSNGIIFILTKDFVKNRVYVVVAKKPQNETDEPFDVVEEKPEFPGGMSELMKFLQENVKYPEEAMKNGIQGRVVVQFVVEKDGSISGAEVIKKVNEHMDAEALRVVNAMPKWTPGKQKGENVRVKFTLPVTFRLS